MKPPPFTQSQRRALAAIVEYQVDNGRLGLAFTFQLAAHFPMLHHVPARQLVEQFAWSLCQLEARGILKHWEVEIALRF